jgi:hypothetical protein|tara:strand:- start:4207 stop:4710 length:504 start_codon:yes stop_codon:yes gene_type:complete
MLNTYRLFAVPVIHSKLPIQLTLHKKIIDFVEKNYTEKKLISCVNGFQFHQDFDGKKEMNEVLNKTFMNINNSYIDYGWLNVLGNNSYNIPHSHPTESGRFSGVYYLSSGNNNIIFTKDGETFDIQPKLFDFLIFPYDLVHYVLPENREEKRICYAFNLNNVETKVS